MIIWLTGNSGSGKTTLAAEIAPKINAIILDGDQMRHTISIGLGFSKEDREEHNLRIARLANALDQQLLNVVVSVIAPFPDAREKITEIIPNVKWIYVMRNVPANPDRPYIPPVGVYTVNMDNQTPQEAANKLYQYVTGLLKRAK